MSNVQDQTPPSTVVPLVLVRRFKSIVRHSVQRRQRRSDYFMSLNDSYACIPPGTPLSSKTHRTSTTVESSGTASPDRDGQEGNESVASRMERATITESVSDAGACGTTASWSFLSLPTIQKTSQCVQFTPSQDISTDEDILLDILTGVNQEIVGLPSAYSFRNHDIEHPSDLENNNKTRHRLAMRPLPVEVETIDQNFDTDNQRKENQLNQAIDDRCVLSDYLNGTSDSIMDGPIAPDTFVSQLSNPDAISPDVPLSNNCIYPVETMTELTEQDPNHLSQHFDPNIPREIFCDQEQSDTSDEEVGYMNITTNDDANDGMHSLQVNSGASVPPITIATGKDASMSLHCLLPCPKDQQFRRRIRAHHQLQVEVGDEQVVDASEDADTLSFLDIICRHQNDQQHQLEEEQPGDTLFFQDHHVMPMLIVEVDHRQRTQELPPPRHRRRRPRRRRQRSSSDDRHTASNDDNIRHHRSRKGYPPLPTGPEYYAPEYASV